MDRKTNLKRKREVISDRFLTRYKRVATESFKQRLGSEIDTWIKETIHTKCMNMEKCDVDEYYPMDNPYHAQKMSDYEAQTEIIDIFKLVMMNYFETHDGTFPVFLARMK